MPDQPGSDETFVEVDGVKFKANPDNPEEALKDDQGKPIPFEEETKETDEQKIAREKKEKEEQEAEDKKEPPVRKSKLQHILDRKDKKIEKLEKKKEEEEKDEDDEFTPEGKKLIDKKIEKSIKPILDQVRGQSDTQELQEVLDKYGEPAKKLKKKIEKYMTHPAYEDVPVEFIFLGLASEEIKKAKKKEEADEEAKKETTGGDQKRPKKIAKIPDVTQMDDQAIGDLVHQVRTGQF